MLVSCGDSRISNNMTNTVSGPNIDCYTYYIHVYIDQYKYI